MFPRRFPRRGEIYTVDFGEPRGRPQAYERPAVIVSNDVNNEHSPTVVVVPFTKRLPAKPSKVNVVIPAGVLPLNSTALCAQPITIDRRDLLQYRGELDNDKLAEVAAGLAIAIGLARPGVKSSPI